ncbi:hypothetical protein [Marinobacter sp.]|uniref:hypothetical protein n=1 Tax=Marinobacter sp. TaxID=50741 RepID=UPI003A929EA1
MPESQRVRNHEPLFASFFPEPADIPELAQRIESLAIDLSLQPDIVLMDEQIGDCSGVTLARLIRFEPRWLSLPIIYLSS